MLPPSDRERPTSTRSIKGFNPKPKKEPFLCYVLFVLALLSVKVHVMEAQQLQEVDVTAAENGDCQSGQNRQDYVITHLETRGINLNKSAGVATAYANAQVTSLQAIAHVEKPAPQEQKIGGVTVETTGNGCSGATAAVTDTLRLLPKSGKVRIHLKVRGERTASDLGSDTLGHVIMRIYTSTNNGIERELLFDSDSELSVTKEINEVVPLSAGGLPLVPPIAVSSYLAVGATNSSDSNTVLAFANFRNTFDTYIDSLDPGEELSFDSGITHSDPDFRRRASVRSASPAARGGVSMGVVQSENQSKIVGGGVRVNGIGFGNRITYSGPFTTTEQAGPPFKPAAGSNGVSVTDFRWSAGGIVHFGTIDVRAVLFPDPSNLYDIAVERANGVLGSTSARATLKPGYIMTGGGCRVQPVPSPTGPQYLLSLAGSFPDETDQRSWI